MSPLEALTLAAYATLVIELTVFPIPSEASTLQLLSPREPDRTRDDEVAHASERSVPHKLLRFALPTAIGVVAFLIPLAWIFWPPTPSFVGRIPALQREGFALAAMALIVLGRALTFSSVLQLRAQRRAASVQASGLFTWSRNPGLVGMGVFYAGLCLGFPCWAMLGALPVYALNMHSRVLLEESRLSALSGDAYRDYLSRVPRYLGLP